jgi:hypothetical protein
MCNTHVARRFAFITVLLIFRAVNTTTTKYNKNKQNKQKSTKKNQTNKKQKQKN